MKYKILLQVTLSSCMILCGGSVQAVVSCSFDNNTGTLTVSGSGELNSYHVTGAVSNKSLITNVVFDANSNITGIGTRTFQSATGLTSIEIPNTVTSIGQESFSGATGLTNITIPNSVNQIWYAAFHGVSPSVLTLNSSNLIRFMANEGGSYGNITAIHCTDGEVTCKTALEEYYNGWEVPSKLLNALDTYVASSSRSKHRIYTIEEANAVAGKTNRFRIKYR